jgi:hypothetical protein
LGCGWWLVAGGWWLVAGGRMWGGFVFARWRDCFFLQNEANIRRRVEQKDIGMRIAAARWLRRARGLEVIERGAEES